MTEPIRISVSSQWFRFIKDGRKTVEGRLNRGKFANMKKGDTLIISNDKQSIVVAVITDIRKYHTFEEYLEQEGLSRTLPGTRNIRDGVAVYRKFYDEKMENEFGVLGIHLHKLTPL